MNPKQFLLLGGVILVALAALGHFGIIGPTADDSIFGANWWFDAAENLAHLVFGVVALLAYFLLKDEKMQGMLVLLVGIVALLVAIAGYMQQELLGAVLENPADTLLHVVVGVWAILAWKMGKKNQMMGGSQMM